MLIVGAKGFAKEVLEILYQNDDIDHLSFFDDISMNIPKILYDKFFVLSTDFEVSEYFNLKDKRYTIGIGNPKLRYKMYNKFKQLGGTITSVISKKADIGSFGVVIEDGCNILSGSIISNDVKINIGTLIYYNAIITHDVQIGKFCEVSPGATLLGRCKINDFVQIGAGAIIFPDVEVGINSIIGAGSVVRENVPDNTLVAGIPAKIKKQLSV